MNLNRRSLVAFTAVLATVCAIGVLDNRAYAATAEDLNHNAAQALQKLYHTNPVAADLSKVAKAYAFVFDQQGLMASLSIEGTKISRIKR